MVSQHYLTVCRKTLAHRHPNLALLLNQIDAVTLHLEWKGTIHDVVVRSVAKQMLSSKASTSILKGLYDAHGSTRKIIHWATKTAGHRGALCGLSQKKRRALSSWDNYSRKHPYRWLKWRSMPTNEIHNEISSIWGFGPWTAEMITIFYFGREDVWPLGDTGLQNMALLVFGTKEYTKFARIISGYETATALFFWTAINIGRYDRMKANSLG